MKFPVDIVEAEILPVAPLQTVILFEDVTSGIHCIRSIAAIAKSSP